MLQAQQECWPARARSVCGVKGERGTHCGGVRVGLLLLVLRLMLLSRGGLVRCGLRGHFVRVVSVRSALPPLEGRDARAHKVGSNEALGLPRKKALGARRIRVHVFYTASQPQVIAVTAVTTVAVAPPAETPQRGGCCYPACATGRQSSHHTRGSVTSASHRRTRLSHTRAHSDTCTSGHHTSRARR